MPPGSDSTISRSALVRSLALVAVVIVLAAGACQRDWEGPFPSPQELGARPLPHPPGGVEAVYAVLTGPGANGEQCHRVVTFVLDGSLTMASVCTGEPVEAVLDELDDPIATGDYSYRDGVARIRLVSWDGLAEELVLDEYDATVCGAELRAGSTFELVAGSPPTGAPPCQAS